MTNLLVYRPSARELAQIRDEILTWMWFNIDFIKDVYKNSPCELIVNEVHIYFRCGPSYVVHGLRPDYYNVDSDMDVLNRLRSICGDERRIYTIEAICQLIKNGVYER